MQLYGVIYTAEDESETDHSVWLTEDDAARAGAKLARAEWARIADEDNLSGEEAAFPEVESDWEAMDALRGSQPVRLEVEPVEIDDDVIRAAFARLT